MKRQNRLLLTVLALLALSALACGSLVSGLVEGATDAALSDLEATANAAATEFSDVAADVQPTLDAALTEAALAATQVGPTLDAAFTQGPMLASADGNGGSARQWAVEASATSQYGDDSWSARQLLGLPDTFPQCGDITTAWASASSNEQASISLFYAQPVIPTQINIYETYNPGAIVRVTVADIDNIDIAVVYEGPAQVLAECQRLFSVNVSGVSFAVQRVLIDLDQSAHPSWNEIDAVELVGNPAQ